MAEVDVLIQSVEQSRAALLSSVAAFSEAQAAFKPGEGQWSVVEILEHLYLAELSGVTKIWTALPGLKAGRGPREAP
jgi:DinB family protein